MLLSFSVTHIWGLFEIDIYLISGSSSQLVRLVILITSLVRSCVAEEEKRNRVIKLGYRSYFKSLVSVSLRSVSKYSSLTPSTQTRLQGSNPLI